MSGIIEKESAHMFLSNKHGLRYKDLYDDLVTYSDITQEVKDFMVNSGSQVRITMQPSLSM